MVILRLRIRRGHRCVSASALATTEPSYGGHDWASLCEAVRPSCTCAMREHSNAGPPAYVKPTPTSPVRMRPDWSLKAAR